MDAQQQLRASIPGLVPTQDEQTGNLAGLTNALGQPVTVYEPGTNTPYPGGTGNQSSCEPAGGSAAATLPAAEHRGCIEYNYQAPVLNNTHQDSLQSRFDKSLGRKDQLYGAFTFQSTRADNVNLFGFVDQTGTLGMNGISTGRTG